MVCKLWDASFYYNFSIVRCHVKANAFLCLCALHLANLTGNDLRHAYNINTKQALFLCDVTTEVIRVKWTCYNMQSAYCMPTKRNLLKPVKLVTWPWEKNLHVVASCMCNAILCHKLYSIYDSWGSNFDIIFYHIL